MLIIMEGGGHIIADVTVTTIIDLVVIIMITMTAMIIPIGTTHAIIITTIVNILEASNARFLNKGNFSHGQFRSKTKAQASSKTKG